MKIIPSILLAMATCCASATTINLSTGIPIAAPTSETVERSVEKLSDGILVTYKFHYADVVDDELFPGYVRWNLPGFASLTTPGLPELPYHSDSFVLPKGSEPTVAIVSSTYRDYEYRIGPARFPIADSDTTIHTPGNVEAVRPFSGMMPQSPVEKMADGMYRLQPVARILVQPLQYNYSQQTVRAYSELVYKISYGGSNRAKAVYREPGSLLNPNNEPVSNDGIATYSLNSSTCTAVDAGYLILSVPEFEESLGDFIKWKEQLGYNVTAIYDNDWTPDKIKETVFNQFLMNNTFMYLLIVGDHSKVPGEEKRYKKYIESRKDYEVYDYITDFQYGCLDGDDDIIPDIYRGRWPVRTVEQLQTVIDKTINYEKSPVLDADFYKKAMHFGYFQDEKHWTVESKEEYGPDREEDRRFVKTCEDVREHVESVADISIDRLYTAYLYKEGLPCRWSSVYSLGDSIPSDFAPDMSIWWHGPTDIRDAINNGRVYALYRGHGFSDRWCVGHTNETGYERKGYFGSDMINQLNNQSKLPLIFSITCQTGNHTDDDCFTRNLLTHQNGGAIGVYAQTYTGLSGINDRLTSLFFNALWPEPRLNFDRYDNNPYLDEYAQNGGTLPLHRLGEMLDFSINGIPIYNVHSAADSLSADFYIRRVTHCFADPGLSFNTEMPTPMTGVTLGRDNTGLSVVLDEPAYIAFNDSINNYQCRYYGTEAFYYTDRPDDVDIAVYNHNKIPYIHRGRHDDGPGNGSFGSHLIAYRNPHGGSRIEIDLMITSRDKNRKTSLVIVDMWSGAILSQAEVDMTIVDKKQTVNMYCPGGIVVASLMVDGYPQSNMTLVVNN